MVQRFKFRRALTLKFPYFNYEQIYDKPVVINFLENPNYSNEFHYAF